MSTDGAHRKVRLPQISHRPPTPQRRQSTTAREESGGGEPFTESARPDGRGDEGTLCHVGSAVGHYRLGATLHGRRSQRLCDCEFQRACKGGSWLFCSRNPDKATITEPHEATYPCIASSSRGKPVFTPRTCCQAHCKGGTLPSNVLLLSGSSSELENWSLW